MEMHQVRYFLAVAEELNFTRAAEKCHVAQPSLTRAIQLLEGELGGPLFHRERANTHLSELGRTVKPYLEQVYGQTLQAKRLAFDFSHMKGVPLKLGIMCTIAPEPIVDLISELRRQHEGIEFQLSDANAWDLQKQLLHGDLEAAIYCIPGQEPDVCLHVVPLFREQIVAALSRQHRLATRNAVTVQDLDGEKYIHRTNCEFAGYADSVFQAQSVRCTPVYWSDRDDWTLAMVAAGLGWAFMPVHAVGHPGVVGLPIIEPEFWREVNLVTVRGRPHSPAVGALAREAMSTRWFGRRALGSARTRHVNDALGEPEPV
jgi:LysR family transcriptional regulator, hydrogen peroxide-inducible genes activator